MRRTVWRYLLGDGPGTQLVAIARSIALGTCCPPPLPRRAYASGASAINYLANGECPEIARDGLSSLLPGGFQLTGFTGLNFDALEPLADAKTVGVLARPLPAGLLTGFKTGGLAGLAILFGGWSDFCLWCWAKYPAALTLKPTVILSRDNGPFVGPRKVKADVDWGFEEASDVRRFWTLTKDPSTGKLFRVIAARAYGSCAGLDSILRRSPVHLDKFEEYVGKNRIFVFNVWPWFRVDKDATGNNIHDFKNLPQVEEIVKGLVDALDPGKIITLGDWAVKYRLGRSAILEPWLRQACGTNHTPCPLYHPSSSQWEANAHGKQGLFGHLPP